MYAHLGKFTAASGRRNDLADRLVAAAKSLLRPGGPDQYSVLEGEGDVVWVFEMWNSKADHDASLELPATREIIQATMPLIAKVESIPLVYRGGIHRDGELDMQFPD
jgi:quinol monooxygenase YgiN